MESDDEVDDCVSSALHAWSPSANSCAYSWSGFMPSVVTWFLVRFKILMSSDNGPWSMRSSSVTPWIPAMYSSVSFFSVFNSSHVHALDPLFMAGTSCAKYWLGLFSSVLMFAPLSMRDKSCWSSLILTLYDNVIAPTFKNRSR